MRDKSWVTWLFTIGLALVIMANMAGPAAWAASDAMAVGQTVPTRTSTPGPEPPPATEPPTPATEPAAPTPTVALTPTSASAPVLLPVAGSDGEGGLALVGVVGLSLLALTLIIRRR